jgi:hypothetical protein
MKRPPRLRLVGKEEAGKRAVDIFDDIEALRAAGTPPQAPGLRPHKEVRYFTQVPQDTGREMCEAGVWDNAVMAVLLELDRKIRSDQKHRNPIPFGSKWLAKIGVTEQTRQRALQMLEKAGVIKIEPQGPGKSPLVALLWQPMRD